MKNWKQSVFFVLVAIIALGFGFVGCDDKTPDPVCECPAGTMHLVGETDCKSLNKCLCEHNVPGTRSNNNIAITNRDNIGNISQSVDDINWAIGALAGLGYSADTLKKNVKEIAIVDSNTVTYDFAKRIIYVGINIEARGFIRSVFMDYLDEPGIVP